MRFHQDSGGGAVKADSSTEIRATHSSRSTFEAVPVPESLSQPLVQRSFRFKCPAMFQGGQRTLQAMTDSRARLIQLDMQPV